MAAILVTLHKAISTFFARNDPRTLQEFSDLCLACACTTSLNLRKGGEKGETLDQIRNKMSSMSFRKVKRELQSHINEQIVSYAEVIDSWHLDSMEEERKMASGIYLSNKFIKHLMNTTNSTQFNKEIAAMNEGMDLNQDKSLFFDELKRLMKTEMRKKFGFNVCVKKSTIPNAGLGLFLEGTAAVGSVVGIFSGAVYTPQYVKLEEYQEELFPDENLNMIVRYDGHIVDPRKRNGIFWHPFGDAFFANHPPKGSFPNVIQVAYDFPSSSRGRLAYPTGLRPYIPNRYRAQPTFWGGKIDSSTLVESVVLIATTDLKDEEILMNYRLPPTGDIISDWYFPVCSKESTRRWDGIFEDMK